MTRRERLTAARALYAERCHWGPVAADAPDLLALRPVAAGKLESEVLECGCGQLLPRFGNSLNHLRSANHIAAVFGLPVREVATGIASAQSVSRAARRLGQTKQRVPAEALP